MGGLIALLVAVTLVTSCAHQEASPCRSDRDCKLERICDIGTCRWAAERGGRHALATPTPTAGPSGAWLVPTPPVPEAVRSMFRLGPLHRGRAAAEIPAEVPTVTWSYLTGGPISGSPLPLEGGAVAVGSHDAHVYVIEREGTLRWSFATGDIIFSSPARLGPATSPFLVVGSDDDHLYALGVATGKAEWNFQVGSCPVHVGFGPAASRCDVDAGPTIGPDGTIYTGGDGIYAIRPDGTLRWRFGTNAHVSSAPAVLPDGTVIAGCQDDTVYAVGPDGQKRWDFHAGADVESSPAVGDDGTIYFGSDDHKVYALAPDGTMKWAFNTAGDVRASVAVGNGLIYVGSFDNLLYAIRTDGTLWWSFRAGDRIVSSPLVDSKGAVLFGSEDDRLYALEPDGRLRWSVELGGDVDSSPVLAEDGTIFVGCDDKKLYALRAGRGAVEDGRAPATGI
jgi:outer membrane protein assembly factor BamB